MDSVTMANTFLGHQWRRLFSHAQFPSSVTFNILRCNIAQQGLTSPSSRHAILVFIVPILINLIEVKFEGKHYSPFETHPKTIMVAIVSLLLYCLAYGAELGFSPQSPTSKVARVLCSSFMTFFGSLSLASLASILLPDCLQFVLYIVHLLISMGELHGIIQKLCKWIHQRILKKICNALQAQSTAHPILQQIPIDVNHMLNM
jgi:hypothetical protein